VIEKSAAPFPAATVPGLLPWQVCFLAFILGIFALQHPFASLAVLAVLAVADASLRGRAHRLPLLVFLLAAAFGYGYAAQRAPDPVDVPAWVEARRPVAVRAVVDSAQPRSGHRLRVVLRDIHYHDEEGERALPGKLVWNWRRPDMVPEPGQSMEAVMRVLPVRGFGNPGAWDYGWYWKRQGVFWRGWPHGREPVAWGERPGTLLHGARQKLREGVARLLPDSRGGAMVLALVTGDRSGLDEATLDETRSAGLAHTLALSGLHVGFVAAIGFGLAWLAGWVRPRLLLRLPRPKLAVILAAPLVLGYAWLGQPSASLIRAAVMFAFWGVLLLQGRGRVLMDGLFFALAAILFVSPLSAYDLSLQMSGVAVAGIGLLYPLIRPLFHLGDRWWLRLLGWAGGILAVSLCANVALLPLISWYFGSWSPNILLNLVWLPALGFAVMPLGIAGALLAVLPGCAPAGGVCLGVASAVMDGLLGLLHAAAGAGLTPVFAVLRPLWPEMAGAAFLLVLAVVAWTGGRVRPLLAGLGLLLLAVPHVTVMAADSRDEVRLSLLDVGLGQAAVISLPGGHRWLVDGGGGSSHFDLGEAVVGPVLARGRPPRLDGVFMSHPDVDHSHGLVFILSRFRVGTFYTNGMLPRGRNGKRMRAVLADRPAPVVLHAGQEVALGDGVSLEVLHPGGDFKSGRANERSLVLRLVRSGTGLALLPGDVEAEGLRALLASGRDLEAEILVLPHHGSRTSFSPDFYRAVSPLATLCSDGYLNRYGFPHREVVRGVGTDVFTTSRHGLVTAAWGRNGAFSVYSFHP
jgi:competence protein ComEC